MQTMIIIRRTIQCALITVFVMLVHTETNADDEIASQLGEILKKARSAQGEIDLAAKLAANTKNEAVRAALGIVQFIRAFEGLSQDYYRFGMEPQRGISLGNMLLPKTGNTNPEPISYADARGIFERFEQRLLKSERTLEPFRFSGIKLPIDVNHINLDLNSDGEMAGNIPLSSIVAFGATGNRNNAGEAWNSVTIAFDDADVLWLRGYIHVMLGTVNIVLAHDWKDAFERTGHVIFSKPINSYMFLREEGEQRDWSSNQLADLIAFIHVINFEVIEPKRMTDALGHFEQVVALSRTTWKWISRETDNDREWLPGPTQNSVVIAGRVGGRLGENWEKVLDRTELVLQGKELIPFWRGYEGGNAFVLFNNNSNSKFHPELGINLRKIFTQPKKFDLVLWIQGTGVASFLEKGKTIDLQAWQDLSESFGGQLPFFSFWIN